MPLDLKMTVDDMISTLDTACGMLLVTSMSNREVREAMEKATKVSLALGEIDEITWYKYDADDGE